LEFRAAISLDTEKLIKRVQDLLCQSKGGVASFDDVLKEMAKLYLDQKDPVVLARKALSKNIKKTNHKKDSSQRLVNRKPLPQGLKNQVLVRDQGVCQAKAFGAAEIKCGDSRWIDVHHITPVSVGGQNMLENLITLCKGHHVIEHRIN
jgi:5-methylcytosine-specific restriction endonuclease McrA